VIGMPFTKSTLGCIMPNFPTHKAWPFFLFLDLIMFLELILPFLKFLVRPFPSSEFLKIFRFSGLVLFNQIGLREEFID
jgi:hypothetical protein